MVYSTQLHLSGKGIMASEQLNQTTEQTFVAIAVKGDSSEEGTNKHMALHMLTQQMLTAQQPRLDHPITHIVSIYSYRLVEARGSVVSHSKLMVVCRWKLPYAYTNACAIASQM